MKYILIILILGISLVTGCNQIEEQNDDPWGLDPDHPFGDPNATPPEEIDTTTPGTTTLATISRIELNSHNQETDCWIAYYGKVYDLTNYLDLHPHVKQPLVDLCGTAEEFEENYIDEHGDSREEELSQVAEFIGTFNSI